MPEAFNNTPGVVNPVYALADVPAATTLTGQTIFVSNGAAGNPVLAFSDGTNWLRCDTRATIS